MCDYEYSVGAMCHVAAIQKLYTKIIIVGAYFSLFFLSFFFLPTYNLIVYDIVILQRIK